MDRIVSATTIAGIGALIGDPARANMLSALMAGQALTASELAWHGGITAPTASGHLARLLEGGLLALERQGRHRYFRLASPQIAQLLESVMAVAASQGPPRYRPRSRIDDSLRRARTCYDHLAGQLGVALTDSLVAAGRLRLAGEGGEVTGAGRDFLAVFGIALEQPGQRRCFCRPCLDWSERRPHLAGALGAGLATRCFDLGWIERMRDTRALTITAAGQAGFRDSFGVELDEVR